MTLTLFPDNAVLHSRFDEERKTIIVKFNFDLCSSNIKYLHTWWNMGLCALLGN